MACCSPWGCKESDMTEQLNSKQILFSVLQILSLYESILKGQNLENMLSCIFQALDILLQKVQSQHN